MSIKPNTTCDIYRAGNAPPSAPDIAGVPCCFVSCFDLGREHGEKEAQQFRYTARMLVSPAADVRDNFNAWTGSASERDTVYVPNYTGIGYNVNFVERINRGLASDSLCVYLDRLAVAWPYPGPAVLSVSPNFGPIAGGTTVTITGRGFTAASAVSFGSTAATSFAVNSDTQITAVSPSVSAGAIDVTVTTALGTSSANTGGQFTFEITVATPTFSPGAGTYTSNQSVTISSSTSGSTIYYTTDGSTPTTSSTLYSSAVTVSTTETLKAIAVHAGDLTSSVGSAAYVMQCATPTFSPAAGAYGPSQTVTISSTSGATIYCTTDGSTPTTSSTPYTAPITVAVSETVKALAVMSGWSNSSIGSASYTVNGACATPTFSPAAGTYTSTQTVTISCSTSGATIYYTTDGSTPTLSSTQYTSPISVSTSETVKAIAEESGYSNSSVGSAAYTINTGPTLVQAISSGTVTSGTSFSATWGSATTTGNMLFLAVSLNNGGSNAINTPSGWTAVASEGGPHSTVAVYRLDSASSRTSQSVSTSSGTIAQADWFTFEFNPASLLGTTDKTSVDSGSSSSATTGSTGTLSTVVEIVVGILSAGLTADGTMSSPVGMTGSAIQGASMAGYTISGTTTAQTFSATVSASTTWGGAIATTK